MDDTILSAMRQEAAACLDVWLEEAGQSRTRIGNSLVLRVPEQGGPWAQGFVKRQYILLLVMAALALVCFFGGGVLYRRFLMDVLGMRYRREAAEMFYTALVFLGVYLLALGVYRFWMLRKEQMKYALLSRADGLIAALEQKKKALGAADPADFAAAAETKLQVGPELASLTAESGRLTPPARKRWLSGFLQEFDSIAGFLLALLHGASLFFFTLMIGIVGATTHPVVVNTPFNYALVSIALGLTLSLLYEGYQVSSSLAFNLLPFAAPVIAGLVVQALSPFLGFVLAVILGFSAFLLYRYRFL